MALTDNIAAYWKFDENTGTTVSDATGNGNTGTFAGSGTKWGTGIIGSAGNFLKTDTTPETVALSANPTSVVDNFTVAGWIKPVIPQATDNGFIFYNGDDSAGWGLGVGANYGGGGSKLIGLFGSVAWEDPSITLSNGVWVHVAMIRRSGTLYFYKNGVQTTGATNTPASPYSGVASVGYETDSNHTTKFRAFSGLIDELGVWSRALTSTEITQLYNGGAGLQYPFSSSTTYNQAITQSATGSISLVRQSSYFRAIAQSVTSVISLSKAKTKVLGITIAATASVALSRLKTAYRTLTQSAASVVSLSRLLSAYRAFSVTATASVTLAKGLLKTVSLAVSALASVTLTRNMASFSATSYGSVYDQGTPWATIHAASAGTERSAPAYVQSAWNGTNYFIERGFLVFDTSSLGSGVYIAAATLTLTGAAISSGGTNTEAYNIYSSTGGTTVSGTDFNKGGTIAFSTAIGQTSLAASGVFTWTLNSSGIAQISKTGNTFFSVREATYDIGNGAPAEANYWGFNTPVLKVTYSTPITYTQNITQLAAATASISKNWIKAVAISVTATISVSLARLKIAYRTLTQSATSVVSLAKQATFYRTITKSATAVVSLAKGLLKFATLTISATASATMTASRLFLKAITQSATAIVTLAKGRLSFKTLTQSVSAVVSLSKAGMHNVTLAVTAAISVTLSKGRLLLRAIIQSATSAVSLSKQRTFVRTLAVSAIARIKLFINGLQSVFASRFTHQGTSYSGKYTPQGTTYSDKYEKQNTDYTDKYQ
jgi:hypothetical protein